METYSYRLAITSSGSDHVLVTMIMDTYRNGHRTKITRVGQKRSGALSAELYAQDLVAAAIDHLLAEAAEWARITARDQGHV